MNQSVGRYHILEQIGEGGMATVYKAYDTRLERHVAVKVILPSRQHTEKFIKRFEREARALAQLSHPNIVKVLDYGEQNGMPFLVMEYIPAGTLKAKLGKPILWSEAARILIPIAKALSYAHEQRIIHRDVKPSNILITQSGEPMLSDYGIAKLLDEEETLDLTGIGVGVGTPEYMAPEQGVGKAVDFRTDMYALGVIFYEMVTGRKPYRADTPLAVMLKKTTEPLPRPMQFVRELPDSVERVMLKTLAKDPENRYQDMTAFISALEQIARGQKPKAVHLPFEETMRPRVGRYASRLSWLLGSGVVLALICIAVVVLGYRLLLPTKETPATQASLAASEQEVIPNLELAAPLITPTPFSTATRLAPTAVPDSDEPLGKIVFTCQVYKDDTRDQICIINADGSGYQRLTTEDFDYAENIYPSLAPDGNSLVFVSNRSGNFEIYEMDLHKRVIPLTQGIGELYGPEISPNGDLIVFANELDGYQRIWIMNRDGSNPYELYDPGGTDALDPAWSPDGRTILFAIGRGESKRLHTIELDGSNLQVLNNTFTTRGRSDWSPDGNTIASYSGESWQREIFLMGDDGTDLRQISSGGNAQAPSFSPDGGWIVFTGYIDKYRDPDGCEIYVMRVDDSLTIRLTDNSYCDWQPRWGP